MERVCGRLWKGRLPASLRVGQSPRSYAAVRPKETVRLSLDPSGNGRNHQCRHISVASFGGFGRNASPSFPNPHRLPIHRRPRLPSQRHFSSVFSTSPGEFSATEHRATRGTAEKNTQHELQRNHAAVATIPPKLRSEVEVAVRRRLHETFPEAFGVIRNNSSSSSSSSSSSNHRTRGTERTMLLSSVRTLLDLNGFQKVVTVVTPSGTKSRLYLAEGVVATPPRWNFRSSPSVAKTEAEAEAKAPSPPFPDGDEHTVPVQNNSSSSSSSSRLGIFAEMNHRLMAYQQSSARDRLFALPVAVSRLHPDDDASSLGYGTGAAAKSATAAAGRQQPSFPEFVQDDITVYRMAENSAARFLDRRYSSWKDWTEKRFVLPLRNARYRTRVMMKAVQKARRNVNAVLEKSVMERVLDAVRGDTSTSSISSSSSSAAKPQSVLTNETKGTDESKEAGNTLASSPAEQDSFHETDPSSNGDGDTGTGTGTGSVDDDIREEPLETLMVVSSQPKPKSKSKSSSKPRHSSTAPTPTHRRRRRDDGYDNEDDDKDDDEIVVSATLYRRMTPSTRILALPDYYVLRHSSASTLVSVSLVVFGALPMAYRSYVFTIDYDWLVDSSVIASSVVGTVLYYLYAARYKARTSQSNTVHRALYSRVYARDDAALMALKEGAFRTVSGAVLREIAIANNGSNNKSSNNNDDNNDDNNKSNNNDDNNNGNNGNDEFEFEFECDGPRPTGVPAASVVDPREWAIDLGFVLVPSSPPTPGRTRTSTSDDDDETNGADSAVPAPGSDGKRYNT
eukprot:jgi/Psemu1/28849/gm1.28849_g